jgi:hypothetical protein
MPDNLLDLDNALSLMNSAPATAATSDWTPDREAPVAELPPEKKEAPAAAAEQPGEQKTDETPAVDETAAKDTPAKDDQGETKDDKVDPEVALPPIEPPSSWKTEEKEVFKTLPRAAQEAIQRREQDRTTELRNLQNTTAEQRKQADGEVARLKGLADQVGSVVNERIADLAREFPEIKTQADVEALAASDPVRFGVFQAKLMRFNAAQNAQQQAQQELSKQQERQQSEFLTTAKEKLLEVFPTWKDPAVGRKEIAELQDYAISLGVPEPHARQAIDPFVYKLAQKAMLYDRAQAAKTQAVNRTPPKVITPGTPATKTEQRADQRTAQLRKLEKSGDLEDAVALMRG